MKRLSAFLALLITSAMLLAACGGGGGSTASGGSTSGGSSASGGDTVSPGASGIKDPALVGKWISADGGSGYNFKDDFSVIVTVVGSDIPGSYNIVSGGQGSGKIEILEDGKKVTWDYKITDTKIDFSTPEGRSRKMSRTT